MDFKVRVLDFICIYVKQNQTDKAFAKPEMQLTLIQGLLNALKVAHLDKHQILFERIKSVLAIIAKQSSGGSASDESAKTDSKDEQSGKQGKMLLTELTSMLLRPTTEQGLQKAYSESFIVLTKHFWDDPNQREFLIFTHKELLKKFLGGRCPHTSGLNAQFFQNLVEQCPQLGWAISKPLLKCFLIKGPQEGESKGEGARTNH